MEGETRPFSTAHDRRVRNGPRSCRLHRRGGVAVIGGWGRGLVAFEEGGDHAHYGLAGSGDTRVGGGSVGHDAGEFESVAEPLVVFGLEDDLRAFD